MVILSRSFEPRGLEIDGYASTALASARAPAFATPGFFVERDAYRPELERFSKSGGFTLDTEEIDFGPRDPLDSIDWGSKLDSNKVKVYFAPAGESYDGVESDGWSQYEMSQAMAALESFATVSGLRFSVTTNVDAATFKLVTTTSQQFLGYFNPPGESNEGVGVFATNGFGWSEPGGLEPGGYGWITLIHEFGHGLGLAHPHDNGGDSTVMLGVTSAFGDYGNFNLNQGIYTTMSYNDGYQLHPDADDGFPPGFPVDYGYQAAPAAFDIALIQDKYGGRENNAGNNVYTLPTVNAAGTLWACIWDTGGKDTIAHSGGKDSTIDLNAATIDYSRSGGGLVSFADGVFGGFTIAAGVVIENARGAKGDDALIGNGGANLLSGSKGNDSLAGNDGKDVIKTGAGEDEVQLNSVEASSADKISDFAAGVDTIALDGKVYDLAKGALAAGRFVLGTAAGDANDRLIYDGDSGRLWFDADGSGAGEQVLLATFSNSAALSNTDFIVI